MDSNKEYDLKDFELIIFKPYIYQLFKDNHDTFLLEVTCGMHGIWQVWIKLSEEEISLYQQEGDSGLEKIAGIFSYYCYDEEYKRRYVKVMQ